LYKHITFVAAAFEGGLHYTSKGFHPAPVSNLLHQGWQFDSMVIVGALWRLVLCAGVDALLESGRKL
jgi:hypothetical protein